MLRHRGVLAATALVALLGGAGSAAMFCFCRPLPDPAVADRQGLFRWLVVRDLSVESAETRRVLARRLDEEFCTGLDWDTTGDRLGPSEREQLWENVVLLLEPWFAEKQERYFGLAAAERPAYLERLLDSIAVWRGLDCLRPRGAEQTDPSTSGGGLLAALFVQVKEWKKDASPQRREQIEQFLLALQTRWLLRNMPQLFSTSK